MNGRTFSGVVVSFDWPLPAHRCYVCPLCLWITVITDRYGLWQTVPNCQLGDELQALWKRINKKYEIFSMNYYICQILLGMPY